MMLTLPDAVLPDELRHIRSALENADWQDGRATAGHVAAQVKFNQQLAQGDAVAERLSEFILRRLGELPRFMAAALPLKVLPPRFNRYTGGGSYGEHIDAAVFQVPGTPHRVRGDISATLFLSEPDEYDGGELVISDTYGQHSVKLPAGHMVIYPGNSLHRVTPVTRGVRYAAFFWLQSLVRDDARRTTLLELDDAIQALTAVAPGHNALMQLTGVYQNLLRQWAET